MTCNVDLFGNLFSECRNRVICSEQVNAPLTRANAVRVEFAQNRTGTSKTCSEQLFRLARSRWSSCSEQVGTGPVPGSRGTALPSPYKGEGCSEPEREQMTTITTTA